MAYILNIGIWLTQGLNTVTGGEPDESFSSHAWRCRLRRKRWALAVRLIDTLFWWQPGHCRLAYEAELHRQQVPPELRGQGTSL